MNAAASDFDAVYRKYYYPILAFLQTHVNETEDAQDLASAVFLSAYRNWEKYDPELASISTWLYCAARNQLKNYYRNRKPVISLELLMDRGEGDSLLEDARFQCVTEWREVLKHALASLPERNRQVVVLRYYAGKSNQEIAEILQITQENARVILTRSLKKLQNTLNEAGFTLEE